MARTVDYSEDLILTKCGGLSRYPEFRVSVLCPCLEELPQ